MGYAAPHEAGLTQRYGVWVGGLGDDPVGSEGWVACTHDRRRAIAAICRDVRYEWGKAYELIGIRTEWWRFATNCGCGETCPHVEDEDGFTEHDDCDLYGLPPCCDGGELSWIGERCAPDAPGAIPVTVVREVVT